MNKRRMARFLPPAILALAVIARIVDPTPVERLRMAAFDEFQRQKPRVWTDTPVRIIDIDDATLERMGQWPWPRLRVAALVDRLRELGAATVAFDVLFAEPDRTSPTRITKLWRQFTNDPELTRLTNRLPDHDRVFARSLADMPTVLGMILNNDSASSRPRRKQWGVAVAGDDPRSFLWNFTGATWSLPGLEASAAGQGSINSSVDADGIIRRIPLLFRLAGDGTISDEVYPSLAAEALRVAQGASTYMLKASGASGATSYGENTGLNAVRIGRISVPTDAKGHIWLYDTGHVPERFIPAWRIFESDFGADRIEGKIVLVGTSAAGLKDIRATPLNQVVAGVEIQAQAIEQMILGAHLVRPDWTTGAEIAWLVVLGIILIVLMPRWGGLWCALVALGGFAVAVSASWLFFAELNWLVDPVYPSFVVLFLYLVQSLLLVLSTEADRRNIRGAFSRYLAPALVERVAKDSSLLKLGGEIRDMTIMFCDIRGFTEISESLEAEDLTRFLNAFLTPMTDVIQANHGTIDKYMGDAIMAFWNAPLDDFDHAEHAVRTAIDMVTRLETLNKQWHEEAEAEGRKHRHIAIGIGLNSGNCCVGNMGSDQRFDYSVLGDVANIASRLEGQSKTYGVPIVAGEATVAKIPEMAWLELDKVRLVGKEEAVRVFTLLGDEETSSAPWFRALVTAHKHFLAAYRARHIEAALDSLQGLEDASQGKIRDLIELYASRLDELQPEQINAEWDGVYHAEKK